MSGRDWYYDSKRDRVRFYGTRSAPSYFEHNRKAETKPLPDVVPADFEPARFQVHGGIVVEESPRLQIVKPVTPAAKAAK